MINTTTDGLTIRRLRKKDARRYLKIAKDPGLRVFVSFFEARNVNDAEMILLEENSYHNTAYGLFKRNKLIAVYTVVPDCENGADICYFVGKPYRGNSYATAGILLLKQKLGDLYDYFTFDVHRENLSSLRVMDKLGAVQCKNSPLYKGPYLFFRYEFFS